MKQNAISINSNQGAQTQPTSGGATPADAIGSKTRARPKTTLLKGEFRVADVQKLQPSRTGNPRWRLTLTAPLTNERLVFTTKPGTSSSYSNRPDVRWIGEYLLVTYQQTPKGQYFAYSWEMGYATFKLWMEHNLSSGELEALRKHGASADVDVLNNQAATSHLFQRYRFLDMEDVFLSRELLNKIEQGEVDMNQFERTLVGTVASWHVANDPELIRRVARRERSRQSAPVVSPSIMT